MTAAATGSTPAPTTAPAPQVKTLLTAVFLTYLGQMTLAPVAAPLAREIRLEEWQVGVTISLAAVMVVLTSQVWGRRSQSLGRKPVLLVAMLLATIAMAVFTLMAWLGTTGALSGTPLFLLFLLSRGLLFGSAIAAVAPTAQAFIADITPDETTRVKGMAGVGAVQGSAMVVGAVVGGTIAGIDLLLSIAIVPVLILCGALLVAFRLRGDAKTTLIENPARVNPCDSRVWPFLLAGFGLYTALGFMQIIAGFLVQDRFHVSSGNAGFIAGMAMLVSGLGLIFSQTVIVPRSGWAPGKLLRIGVAISLAGFLLLLPDAGYPLLFISMALIGLGLGIASPGFTAGPSLLLAREEQGGMAGLIGATMGLTFVVAPTASTILYRFSPTLPLAIAAAIMALVLLLVLTHPRFRGGSGR